MPIFDGQFGGRFKSRTFLSRGKKRFGQGSIISKVQNRADKLTTRMKGRKTNIIPSVEEAFSKWNAGSRITEMLPTPLKRRSKSKKESKVTKHSRADISL